VYPGQSFTALIQFSPKPGGGSVRHASLTLPGASGTKPLVMQFAGTALASRTVHTDAAGAGGVVQVATTQAGKGAGAVNGQILSISYVGYLADGTVIDSSASHPSTAKTGLTLRLDDAYGQRQPFLNKDKAFPVEQGGVDINVIAGWEFGLQGIKVGEKRTLIMNAAAAYGTTGVGGIVPANATLRFDVQCVAIPSKPALAVSADQANGTPAVMINAGQTAVSVNGGTILTASANQTAPSQRFSLLSISSDKANGMALGNITVSSITLSGAAATDFAVTRSGNDFTLTFHPKAGGNRNATVHIHSNDRLHPDFTFAVRGQSGNAALALVAAK
jgi:FKBP-type peptidyl-prolyl cis-trans isomerase